ncbi:MAG TPA: alpha-galactosidase, partial [Thermomicrobiales bacterium]|nr:alpha-galactosidase [Thermomicrobiales bacterium]
MSTFDAAPVVAGTAYVRADRSKGFTRWTIGNADLTCSLGWLDDRILQFETIERTDNHGIVVRASREVFALTVDNLHRLTADATRVSGVETSRGDTWVHLRIHLASEGHGSIAFVLECRDGHPILRQWLEYAANGPVTITTCDPWLLEFANPGAMLLKTVAGVQQQGGWHPESGVYRSFRLEERNPIEGTVIESGLRSTWDECPWVAVVPRDGTEGLPGGALIAFDYGGQWQLSAHPEPGSASFTLGFSACVHAPSLTEGAGWTSPATWVGVFPDDLDTGSQVWVDYLRTSVIPDQPADFPWVQFNTWYSHYCDLDGEELLQQAAIAADLGVEVFYVDAGWWEGNPRRRDNFASGLGTWRENRDKFPDGIAAFADGIRELGMHFGIWAEPERVDLRTATTAGWKPEWLATANGDYLGPEWPRDTQTAWLCFGHPETQAWAAHTLGDMIESFGVR